jgi:hypothetical protein
MTIDLTALLTIQVHPDTRRRAIVSAGNDLNRIERLLSHARTNELTLLVSYDRAARPLSGARSSSSDSWGVWL